MVRTVVEHGGGAGRDYSILNATLGASRDARRAGRAAAANATAVRASAASAIVGGSVASRLNNSREIGLPSPAVHVRLYSGNP